MAYKNSKYGFPCPARLYAGDAICAHLEFSGEGAPAFFISEPLSNDSNRFVSQFRRVDALTARESFRMRMLSLPYTSCFETVCGSVLMVLFGRDMFQIFNPIVLLITVLVVYLMTRRAFAKKGAGDDTMDDHGSSFPMFAQAQVEIAIAIKRCAENMTGRPSVGRGFAPYRANVRDRIKSFISEYWQPFFFYFHACNYKLLRAFCIFPESVRSVQSGL